MKIKKKFKKSVNYQQISEKFFATVHANSLQLCLTLCDPMDCSPPGFSIHRILQARILEWVAMLSSRGSSRPRNGTSVSYVSCIGRQVLLPLAFFYLLGIRKTEIATKVLTDSTFLRSYIFSCYQTKVFRKVSSVITNRLVLLCE